MRLIVLMLLLITLLGGIAMADIGTAKMNFSATDDAKVISTEPNENTGDLQLRVGLQVTSIFRTYLKFNISQIPSTSTVQNAKVYIYKFGGIGSGNVLAFRVLDNNWFEEFITWNNAPTDLSGLVSSTFIDADFEMKEIDISQGLADALAAGQKEFSVMLRNADESQNTVYHLLQNKEQSIFGPVLEANFISNKPTITQTNAPTAANEGDTLQLSFSATDPDNNIRIYQIYFNNKLIANSSSATYRINFEESGARQIRFYVEDITGLSDEEIININVANVNNIQINELLPIPAAGSEWIELYNPTNADFNVIGCYVQDGFGINYSLNGTLFAKDTGVINNVQFLTDTGDIVKFVCNNTLFDRVVYGNWNDSNATDNAPAASMGQSIGRENDGIDTDVDVNDFIIYNAPTKDALNNPIPCEDSDENCNGCIEMLELLSYIGRWKADSNDVTMLELLHAIGLWKSAEGC